VDQVLSRRDLMRRVAVSGMALGLAPIVQACAPSGSASAPTPAAATSAAAKTAGPPAVFRMASFPGPSISAHNKAIIKAKAFDTKHNWKLEWVTRPNIQAYYNDLLADQYDGLDGAASNVVADLYNKGAKVKLAQAVTEYPLPMMVRANSGINDVKGLKGKRVGLPFGSYTYAHVLAYGKSSGIDLLKESTVTNADFFTAPNLLRAGDLDGVPLLFELAIQLVQAQPGTYKMLFDTATEFARTIGVEKVYQYQAIRADWVEKNPGAIDRVFAAFKDVEAYIPANLTEATDILARPADQGGAALTKAVSNVEYGTGYEGLKAKWVSRPVSTIRDLVRKELEVFVKEGLIAKMPDDGLYL
jgi:ABC-type nitrate/sulfonate/bicarbonate transport system substrate-binding protein